MAHEHDLVLAVREHAPDQGVALLELDPAQAPLARGVRVVGEVRLLRDPGLRRHDEVEGAREVLHADHGRDLLALGQPRKLETDLPFEARVPSGTS